MQKIFFDFRRVFFLVCFVCGFLSIASANTVKKDAPDSTKENAADSSKANALQINWENSFSFAAIFLSHRSLRNSDNMRSWPFFLIATPLGWTSTLKMQKNFGKLLGVKSAFTGDLNLMGAGVRATASIELLHLFEIGTLGSVNSAINYSSDMTQMGVYNSEKKKFENDYFMTEFLFNVKYFAAMTFPLMAILPKSDWTKSLLKPNASFTFLHYTGAADKEMWKAGNELAANGYRYQYGATLLYMLPFRYLPMAMLSYNVIGIVHKSDYDAVYDDYDPSFKNISITPMLSIQFSKKWSGMLMTKIERVRKFARYHFDEDEELLQKRIGYEWAVPTVIFIVQRKF